MIIKAKLVSKTRVIDPYFNELDDDQRPVAELRIMEDYPFGGRDEKFSIALAVVPIMAPVVEKLEVGEYYDFAVTATRLPVHQFFNILVFAGIRALISAPEDLLDRVEKEHNRCCKHDEDDARDKT